MGMDCSTVRLRSVGHAYLCGMSHDELMATLYLCWSWIPGCSAVNAVTGTINDLVHMVSSVINVFSEIIEFFVNPTGAILYMFFGIKSTPSTSPLALLLPIIGCHIDGACNGNIFNAGPSALAGKLAQSTQVLAVAIAGVCAAARALKLVVTKEGPGWVSVVLVDVLGRLCVVIGLIYVGYDVLIILYNASADLGSAIMYGFFNTGTNDSLPGVLTQLFNNLLGGWLMTLLADLMSIYVFAVLVAARILFLFGATMAPLVIAITAYSEKTQVVSWYGRLMMGTLLTPLVAGTSVGVVGAFAAAADSNLPVIGNFMVAMIFIAGFWFIGKCLRELCTSAFDLAAFGVAVATSVVAIAATIGAAVATGGVSLAGAGAAGGGGMPLIGDGANPMDPTGGGGGGAPGRELASFSGVQMPSAGGGQPHMPGATPEFEDFVRSAGRGGGARAAAMGSSAEEFSETQSVTQTGGGGAPGGGGGGGFVGGLGGAALRALSQSNPLSHIDNAFWGHQHGASHVVNQAAGTAGYGGGYGGGGGGAVGGGGGGVVQGGQTTVEHTVTARRKVDWAAFMATNPDDFSSTN